MFFGVVMWWTLFLHFGFDSALHFGFSLVGFHCVDCFGGWLMLEGVVV